MYIYVQELENGISGRALLESRQEPAAVARSIDQRVVRIAVRANCRQTHRSILIRLIVRLLHHRRSSLYRPLANQIETRQDDLRKQASPPPVRSVHDKWLAVWRSGSVVRRMNEVALR